MISRRSFLVSGAVLGGGLLVGINFLAGNPRQAAKAHLIENDQESLLTTWLKIDTDSTATIFVPHSEMGQGVLTGVAMMLAEELDADWDKVVVERAPAVSEFANWGLAQGFLLSTAGITVPKVFQSTADFATFKLSQFMNLQVTGGSTAVRFTGHVGMRAQGAAAREMLVAAAAEAWQVPVAEIITEKSTLSHPASGKVGSYGDFASAAAQLEPSSTPKYKTPDQYRIVGRNIPRVDIPGKVDGSTTYGVDVYLPNMKHAAIKAPAVVGAEIVSHNGDAIKGLDGVEAVVDIPGAVAVVAESFWQAKSAAEKIELKLAAVAHESLNSEQLFEQQAEQLDAIDDKGTVDVEAGVPVTKITPDQIAFKAEYTVPFLAHAAMEPVNSTVRVNQDGSVEMWAGLQDGLGGVATVADLLGVEMEKVTLNHVAMGGAFGRRGGTLNFLTQTAQIANQMKGIPIKLTWTREQDMQHDYYRPALSSRFNAVLDRNKNPVSWINSYIGKNEPAEAAHIPYNIPNQLIRYIDRDDPIPFGPWRSVAHSQQAFFTESFIDELADAAGTDGYEYRARLLKNKPRHLKVLQTAAKAAGWGEPMPSGWGRGIAIHESFQSIVAQVVEVSFIGEQVKPERVVCAIDCGRAINPDSVEAQMESGIIFGMTAALYGEISVNDGGIKQSNFHDYPMLRMNLSPRIETHIVASDAPLGGVGEPGTPPIAPAITNAIFNATGVRVRGLPVGFIKTAAKESNLG